MKQQTKGLMYTLLQFPFGTVQPSVSLTFLSSRNAPVSNESCFWSSLRSKSDVSDSDFVRFHGYKPNNGFKLVEITPENL